MATGSNQELSAAAVALLLAAVWWRLCAADPTPMSFPRRHFRRPPGEFPPHLHHNEHEDTTVLDPPRTLISLASRRPCHCPCREDPRKVDYREEEDPRPCHYLPCPTYLVPPDLHHNEHKDPKVLDPLRRRPCHCACRDDPPDLHPSEHEDHPLKPVGIPDLTALKLSANPRPFRGHETKSQHAPWPQYEELESPHTDRHADSHIDNQPRISSILKLASQVKNKQAVSGHTSHVDMPLEKEATGGKEMEETLITDAIRDTAKAGPLYKLCKHKWVTTEDTRKAEYWHQLCNLRLG